MWHLWPIKLASWVRLQKWKKKKSGQTSDIPPSHPKNQILHPKPLFQSAMRYSGQRTSSLAVLGFSWHTRWSDRGKGVRKWQELVIAPSNLLLFSCAAARHSAVESSTKHPDTHHASGDSAPTHSRPLQMSSFYLPSFYPPTFSSLIFHTSHLPTHTRFHFIQGPAQ